MNIYIHVEFASRELDSKLLLALRAAERGHEVLVHHMRENNFNLSNFVLGIFHTGAILPGAIKIKRHQKIKDSGHLITVIDEEHGLLNTDYEPFAKKRFSNTSLEQADAIFCWGELDYSTLREMYPDHKNKIYCTGSPRADIWKSGFPSMLHNPQGMPQKPYVLISSNFGIINNYRPFLKELAHRLNILSSENNPNMQHELFCKAEEQMAIFINFIQLINNISTNHPQLNIVVRPHPVEDPESWKNLLPARDNIHIIRTGSITPWVHHALAVIHNGCTTALEATISGTPVIAYTPFEQKYAKEVPNQLGFRAYNQEEVLNYILQIKQGGEMPPDMKSKVEADREIVSKRVRYLDQEMAAERMIRVWEEIGYELPDKKNNWLKIRLKYRFTYGLRVPLNTIMKNMVEIVKGRLNLDQGKSEKIKFPPLDMRELHRKVEGLRQDLGITKEIQIRKISQKAVVITAK